MTHPAPPAVRKRGIDRAETNLEPDQRVAPPDGLIAALFGQDLLAHLTKSSDKRGESHAGV